MKKERAREKSKPLWRVVFTAYAQSGQYHTIVESRVHMSKLKSYKKNEDRVYEAGRVII